MNMLLSVLGGILMMILLLVLVALVLRPKGTKSPAENLRDQPHGDADDAASGEDVGHGR